MQWHGFTIPVGLRKNRKLKAQDLQWTKCWVLFLVENYCMKVQ